MKVMVRPDGCKGLVLAGDLRLACAIGRGGAVRDKREGDGATPVGRYPIRRLVYRPDRIMPPAGGWRLPASEIAEADGWCDDPADPAYNRPVTLPYPASTECMWREDRLYDMVVILGHNDDPPVPGRGSAIFMHVAKPDYAPTEGCVALDPEDLRRLLALIGPGDEIEIAPPQG
jgi:L,D-peptidoglycan transpeptidase YkuD (ErfK/YbiS/YcfS/YnhG family)